MTGENAQLALFGADPIEPVPTTDTGVPEQDEPVAVSPNEPEQPEPASPATPQLPKEVSEAPAASEPARLPPVGTAADSHAAIITEEGCFTPSGLPRRAGRSVESVEILAKLLTWLGLKPKGAVAQVYIVGVEACDILGWEIDPGSEDDFDSMKALREHAAAELAKAIRLTIGPLNDHGWFLRKNKSGKEKEPGHYINLERRTDGDGLMMVDVILEPYSWTYPYRDIGWSGRIGELGIFGNPTAGTYLPDDAAEARRELGRRLHFSVEQLGVLPGPTPARTGAAIQDQVVRTRTRSGKGVVVTEAGPLPPLNDAPSGEIEPPVVWTRSSIDPAELENAAALVTIDQRAAYLASAGMLAFGYGTPQYVQGDVVARMVRKGKNAPFGVYRVTMPALRSLNLPDTLPPILPVVDPQRTDPDQPVNTWVTGISLDKLQAPVSDGGAGLDLDDLEVSEAWMWPSEGKALEAWKKRLAPARKLAVETGDAVMKRYIGVVYKAYIGRMHTDKWDDKFAHHSQPVWWAAIVAHCRWRGRSVAMENSRTHGLWPLHTATDSWVYAVPAGVDLADPSDYLGKMVVEKQVVLTEEIREQLLAATTPSSMRAAITAAFGEFDDDLDDEWEQ